MRINRLTTYLLTLLADFSDTAENVRFGIEGGASVPVLRARLKKLNGEWVDADVNLAERVKNEDGRFVFGEQELQFPFDQDILTLITA